MTAVYHSGETARKLSEAVKSHEKRVRALNRVAAGEEVLTKDQRDSLLHSERKIREYLILLNGGVSAKARVVTMEAVSAVREHLPMGVREAYELLFIRAYGSDPAVSHGDPVVDRSVGKRQYRTSTSRPAGVGGAASGGGKKPGASTRNIIKDRRAYEMKIKVDRRLRRLAKDIQEMLEGNNSSRQANVCSRCGRIGEDDWAWCPADGFQMKLEARE